MYATTATLKYETDSIKEWSELLVCAYERKERGDIIRVKSGIEDGVYYVKEIIKERA